MKLIILDCDLDLTNFTEVMGLFCFFNFLFVAAGDIWLCIYSNDIHVKCQKIFILVSVTQLAWFDEDKNFAVAYSDGVVSLCSKLDLEQPVTTEAHQVTYWLQYQRYYGVYCIILLLIYRIDKIKQNQ